MKSFIPARANRISGDSTSTTVRSGNSLTGAFSATSTSEMTSSLSQSGTIGERTFTVSQTSESSSASTTSGNEITGESTGSQSGTSESSYAQTTVYADGSDTKTVASSGSSSGAATQNAITGVFSSTSTSTSQQTVSESGDRGAAYTLAFTSEVDADQSMSGNAITGAYASQSTSSSSSHSTRAITDPAAGAFTVEETSDGESSETASGNSITAVSTSSSTLESSTVTLTTSANAAGTVRFSATATSTIDSESTAAVNAITGSLAQTTESTRTEQLAQSGVTTTAAFVYESESTTTGTTETTGNLVTGQLTIETHNGVTTYTFTQDVDNTDGSGYTLAGSGQKTFDRTTTTNGQTGEYSSTENGVDDYLLEQTHTAGGTTTTTVLDGEETYTETETGNSETGEFTREASGSGDADRSVTVSDGATTTTTQDVVQVQWVLSQARQREGSDYVLRVGKSELDFTLHHGETLFLTKTGRTRPKSGGASQVSIKSEYDVVPSQIHSDIKHTGSQSTLIRLYNAVTNSKVSKELNVTEMNQLKTAIARTSIAKLTKIVKKINADLGGANAIVLNVVP